ncbi:MAG: Hpt domain-containing protein [Spirochaetales bacterium]|nr:Hpt domain-containing protein [Spirochaetales bacterium]
MDSKTLLATFQDDAGLFIDRLNNTLMHLEKERENLNLVHQAFRFIHSIKSEASYMQLDEITKVAHNLETLLDILRREQRGPDNIELASMYECVDELQQKLQHLQEKPSFQEPLEVSEEVYPEPLQPQEEMWDDLEKALLSEARRRGEGVYSLTCEIEESAPMKKSRVFLIVNNLELIVNVISVTPSLEEEQDESFRYCAVLFTSDTDEEAVRRAVCVDQVRRVQITPLDYESLLSAGSSSPGEQKTASAEEHEGFYRVSPHTLDELFEYLDQLKLTALRLSAGLRNQGDQAKEAREKELKGIQNLTESLDSLLKDIRKVRLSSWFSRLHRMVRDLSTDLGKQVELEMDFGDLSLDRNTADILGEMISHLLRNAVDHGIERPEERQEMGKPVQGRVEIHGSVKDGSILVHLQDDGRGISEEEITSLARNQGILKEGMELLDILAAPGFSTRSQATDYSGRGVGLDVVKGKLERTGGSLSLETRGGEGSRFSILLPLMYNPVGVLLVRCGEETLAVPLKHIRERYVLTPEGYSRDERGYLSYNGDPVYGIGGKVLYSSGLPSEPYGLALRHMGRRGVLLVDEMLFEKELDEESLQPDREIRPHIFSLGQKDLGYKYLSPSLISADL